MNEHQIQCQIAEWASLNSRKCPALKMFFAVPNGGARHIVVGAKLKKEGVKKGVFDIFIDYPSQGYHGFRGETKTLKPKGYLTKEQKEWGKKWQELGYYTCVFRSLEEFIEEFNFYLNGEK